MKKRLSFYLLLFACLLLFFPSLYAADFCSVCGKEIHGNFLQNADSVIFCSKPCYEKTLPICSACGKTIRGKGLRQGDVYFCNNKCFEKTLPKCELCGKKVTTALTIENHIFCETCASFNRCFQCQLPFSNGRTLNDGRNICSVCAKEGVFLADRAERLYKLAANAVENITGFDLDPLPDLELIGIDKMKELAPLYDERIYSLRGTYHTETIKTTYSILGVQREKLHRKNRVLLLYGLTSRRIYVTSAHELTHHIIETRFPRLADDELWKQEGLCQYVAHIVALRKKFSECGDEIERYDDELYGKGFAWYIDKFGADNWHAVSQWLETMK